MEQENRIMFARCHNLKRKRRIYVKSKVPASLDNSDEEEAPENQIGSINNLKRKRRSYVKSKVPASPDSSDEEEAPESQIGSINIYNHYEEQKGWSSPYRTCPKNKNGSFRSQHICKAMTTEQHLQKYQENYFTNYIF